MYRSTFAVALLLIVASSAHAQPLSNFRVGIQVSDHGTSGAEEGKARFTGWASDRNNWSDWAYDLDRYDPDAIRVKVEAHSDEVLKDVDIRLAIRLTDQNEKETGSVKYTPWASDGGGWSGWAFDMDAYDFDSIRIGIETRPKKGLVIRDSRVGIQLADHKGAEEPGGPQYSEWLSKGGNWSERAADKDAYDPDAVRVKLDVRVSATK